MLLAGDFQWETQLDNTAVLKKISYGYLYIVLTATAYD